MEKEEWNEYLQSCKGFDSYSLFIFDVLLSGASKAFQIKIAAQNLGEAWVLVSLRASRMSYSCKSIVWVKDE